VKPRRPQQPGLAKALNRYRDNWSSFPVVAGSISVVDNISIPLEASFLIIEVSTTSSKEGISHGYD
jgi:hypothetical protein